MTRLRRMMWKKRSSLSLVSSFALFCSSAFAIVFVQTNLSMLASVLPLVWFISVAVASGICCLVLGKVWSKTP